MIESLLVAYARLLDPVDLFEGVGVGAFGRWLSGEVRWGVRFGMQVLMVISPVGSLVELCLLVAE